MIYWFPNRPLLFSPAQLPGFEGKPGWTAEPKLNGDRMVLRRVNGKFEFWNRHQAPFKTFVPAPGLLEELEALQLPDNTQLDGELMHFKTKHIKQRIVFFDIYVWAGEQLWTDLRARRELLKKTILFSGVENHIQMIPIWDNSFVQAFETVIKTVETEGLVLKNDTGKIVWNARVSPDVTWQVKFRRPHKNYQF